MPQPDISKAGNSRKNMVATVEAGLKRPGTDYIDFLWGRFTPDDLSQLTQPTLIANGDNDRMVPSVLSEDLHRRTKDSELIVYPELSSAKETDERAPTWGRSALHRGRLPHRHPRMLTKWILSRPEAPALTVRQSPL